MSQMQVDTCAQLKFPILQKVKFLLNGSQALELVAESSCCTRAMKLRLTDVAGNWADLEAVWNVCKRSDQSFQFDM
jgi:hypothetical protein